MDSKAAVKAGILIGSVLALIMLVVYMMNEKQFRRMLNPHRQQTDNATQETSGESALQMNADGYYGEQIGEDLKAFLADASFFDDVQPTAETRQAVESQGTLDGNTYTVMMAPKVAGKSIVISLIDEAGNLVTGEDFVIEMNGLHLYKDDDKDGVVYIEDLASGVYQLQLKPQDGFQTQKETATVEVN